MMPHIYRITNLINKKIYVGKSLREDEFYMGSGLLITSAIEKYGKENFLKEILEECSEETLDQKEIYWIEKLNARNTDVGYNISIGGTGGNHYWKSLDEVGKQELRDKISMSKTGATINYTDEQRKNVKTGLKKFWDDFKSEPNWRDKLGNPKKYILSDKLTFIRIENLGKYSKTNSLDKGWLTSISTGKKFTPCKGYYCFLDIGQSDNEVLQQIKIAEDKFLEIERKWLEKTRNRQRYECIYCKKIVTKSNLTRWHNNNCKENANNKITDIR